MYEITLHADSLLSAATIEEMVKDTEGLTWEGLTQIEEAAPKAKRKGKTAVHAPRRVRPPNCDVPSFGQPEVFAVFEKLNTATTSRKKFVDTAKELARKNGLSGTLEENTFHHRVTSGISHARRVDLVHLTALNGSTTGHPSATIELTARGVRLMESTYFKP